MKTLLGFKSLTPNLLIYRDGPFSTHVTRQDGGWSYQVFRDDVEDSVAWGRSTFLGLEDTCHLAVECIARLKAAEPAAPVVGEVS